MSAKKFYSVIVGGKPAKVEVGFLDDDRKPIGTPTVAYIERAGTAVPNYSTVWAKRTLETKTKEPTGELTFLPWEHPDGQLIELRYLKNSMSLDKEFQEKKKMRVSDDDAEIPLFVGINNYEDTPSNRMLIMMLTYHYQNDANECRPPGTAVAFSTYDSNKITKLRTDDIQRRQEVELIVMHANDETDQALEILASLFSGIDPRQQKDVLFEELMNMTPNFGFFLNVLSHHRDEYRDLLNKAKDIELIDVTPSDAIYIRLNGAKEILLQDIKSGIDEKVMYVLKFFYKPEYFNALQKLKEAYKKFEGQLE